MHTARPEPSQLAAQVTVMTLTEGLSCATCVERAHSALQAVAGVTSASVNLANRQATISYMPDLTSVDAICRHLQAHGFSCALGISADFVPKGMEFRRARTALLLATPVILCAMLPHALQTTLPSLAWLQLICTSLLLAWPGRMVIHQGLVGLVNARADMDGLITIGAGTAFLSSAAALSGFAWTAQLPFSFESAAVIVTLVLIGRWLEARARNLAGSAVEALLAHQPLQACLVYGGVERLALLREIQPGDLLRVRTGDRIPVDGTVMEGACEVDEAMLTGEARPIGKGVGAQVYGGCIDLQGGILMRADAVGSATALARLAEQVQRAQGTKPSIARLADRLSAHFVVIVLLLALATLTVWWLLGNVALGFQAAVSVLIIACPCALGLATPTAVMVAVGRAAELGLLIRSGAALEVAPRITYVLFDKTGTLTDGRFTVRETHATAPFASDEVLRLAALAERDAQHPVAAALREAMPAHLVPEAAVVEILPTTQAGARARIDGRLVLVGSPAFLEAQGVVTPAPVQSAEPATAALTHILVAVDGRIAGTILLSDGPRAGNSAVVARLRDRAIAVEMLTGDQAGAAALIARDAGISEIRTGQSPLDKCEHVKRLQAAGHVVAMVGDGINDAPALAQADISFALGTASDIAARAGDVVLLSGRLDGILTTMDLSQAAIRTIHRNLFGALVYNVIALPSAAGAFYCWTGMLLDPMLAAAAMAASSVTVVVSSLRLRRFHRRLNAP